jgi:predicted dehydrogenase
MTRKTRWAVAGTGGITARTVPDLALTENVEVVAVSSRTQQRADTFASEFSIPRSYGAYQVMLADPDVDVVSICTPNGSHFAMAAQAVRAGKHVLCEKPFAVNAAQASRLADLARAHNVFSMAVQSGWTEHPAHPLSATIRTLELVDEVRRQLLDTYYPARGALDPWDSVPEMPLDVRN